VVDWVQVGFEFLAAFAGVVAAFIGERAWERHLNKVREKELLELILN
jgi:hypothetical protein